MRLSNFFLYRWCQGGKWVLFEGSWYRAQNIGPLLDFIDHPDGMFHYTHSGIEAREDFT
jgi:hypothetical protein